MVSAPLPIPHCSGLERRRSIYLIAFKAIKVSLSCRPVLLCLSVPYKEKDSTT